MHVTESAQEHFRALLKKEDSPGMNLRIYVAQPFTPFAEIGLTFCPAGEEENKDIPLDFNDFKLLIAEDSFESLKEASIDFQQDEFGGQLSIKAPGLRGQRPPDDAPLPERIKFVLDTEINPTLAGHGGRVSFIEILEEKMEGREERHNVEEDQNKNTIVVLQFGGGCHGCGMANVTLKSGIEKTLMEKFPEIKEVRDITDHASGENPYYTNTSAHHGEGGCHSKLSSTSKEVI